jgi:hypothetical protein
VRTVAAALPGDLGRTPGEAGLGHTLREAGLARTLREAGLGRTLEAGLGRTLREAVGAVGREVADALPTVAAAVAGGARAPRVQRGEASRHLRRAPATGWSGAPAAAPRPATLHPATDPPAGDGVRGRSSRDAPERRGAARDARPHRDAPPPPPPVAPPGAAGASTAGGGSAPGAGLAIALALALALALPSLFTRLPGAGVARRLEPAGPRLDRPG